MALERVVSCVLEETNVVFICEGRFADMVGC